MMFLGVVPPMGGPPSGQQQAPQTPMWKKDGDWSSMGPSAAGPGWSDRGMGVVRPELGVGPAPWQQVRLFPVLNAVPTILIFST